MRQTYRQQEAEEILKRAITHPPTVTPTGEVTQEELESMAEELGIDPEALRAAVEAIESEQAEERDRQEFIAKRRVGFMPHLYSYLGVMGFLLIINLLTTPGYLWVIWPALGWGLGLYFHAVGALPTRGATFEAAFARWREERIKREERRKKNKDKKK